MITAIIYLIEKGNNISVDKIPCVEDVCGLLGIKVKDGFGRRFNPRYLMLFLKDNYIGTAYGSKFVFNESLDDKFIEDNYGVLKSLNDHAVQIYSRKVKGFDKWKK